MRYQPQQDPFGDAASEPLPNQFYLVDTTTGEYRQYSAVSPYTTTTPNQGGAAAPGPAGRPRMHAPPQGAASRTAPAPAPFTAPIAVGSPASAVVAAAAGSPAASGGAVAAGAGAAATHPHRGFLDHLLPAGAAGAAGASPALLAGGHPQLEQHHNHNHNHSHHLELRHLQGQPLPQLHQRQIHPFHLQGHALHPFPDRAVIMASPDEHGMAAQQEAAKGYLPTLDGPMIGEKTPIASIVDEYAKADPIYVDKTMALPQTYGEYRPVKGDGNCGWRAIGFSYFEKLAEGGDADQIEGEVARLMSMTPFLGSVGGYDYYEDWADEAIGLLRELAGCVTDKAAAQALIHQRWTDIGTGSSLIYYLRLLAATHLKSSPEQYDPFVPDGQGIQSYCAQSVELPDREIEQLGIIALYNCLLKPLDFVLEIAYLDRSPGAEVNTYRFPEGANGKDLSALGPVIYLLYRPDHYDILYRRQLTLPAGFDPAPVSMQVNRATELYSHTPITSTHSSLGAYSTADFSILASLPSASTSSMPSLSSYSGLEASSCGSFAATDSQWMPSLLPEPSEVAPAQHVSGEVVASPAGPKPRPSSVSTSSPDGADCNIRFTKMQYNYEEDSVNARQGLIPFYMTSDTFKNSVWNRAHFGNPDFRPEQWHPGDESLDERTAGARKKKAARNP
ncbi:hypothetical protein PWT90_01222 [Aphanocladium album]|nr:hypothetical protein PWT90_01222 [Aphanocladium album]